MVMMPLLCDLVSCSCIGNTYDQTIPVIHNVLCLTSQITYCTFRVYIFSNRQITSLNNLLRYFPIWFATSRSSLPSALVVYHTSIIPLPRNTDSYIDTACDIAVEDTFWNWSVKVTSDLTAQANLYFRRKPGHLFSVSNRSSILLRYTCFRISYWFCSQVYNSKNNGQLIGKKTRQWTIVLLYQISSNLYFFVCSLSIYYSFSESIFSVAVSSSDDCFHYCMQVVCSLDFQEKKSKQEKKKMKLWLVSYIIIISSPAQTIHPKG